MMKTFLQFLLVILCSSPVTSSGECLKGDCKNGCGVEVSPIRTYVGHFRNGQFHGQGVLSTFDGNKLVGQVEGDWKNGIPEGHVVVTNPDGSRGLIEWKDGIPHSSSGGKNVGQSENHENLGVVRITYPDGRIFVGNLRDGVPHGKGTMTYPDGTKQLGQWKNGKFVRE